MTESIKPVIKINDGAMAVAIFEQPIQTEYGERKALEQIKDKEEK